VWRTWRARRSWAYADTTVTLAIDYAATSLLWFATNRRTWRMALAKIDATEGANLAVFRRADQVCNWIHTYLFRSVSANLVTFTEICFFAALGIPSSPRLARSWGSAERHHHHWGRESSPRTHDHSRLPRLPLGTYAHSLHNIVNPNAN
jgi:hypothetical protein